MQSFGKAQDRHVKCKIAPPAGGQNSKFILAAIFFIGIILRLINLESWFHFEMDEEVIAWKVREFILTGKPFLIGGSTPFGFHVGPAFYYLSAIPLFFSKLDPGIWGIWGAIFGGLSILLAYKAGEALYSRKIGLIFALLWSTSFVQIFSDRHWWPMVLNPLMGLLAVWSWWGIIGNKGRKWWLLLGAVLTFAWQADLSNLILFLGTGMAGLILLIKKKLKENSLGILGCLGILGVSFMPLIFFEVRHPGANLGKISEYQFISKQIDSNKIVRSLLLPAQVAGSMVAPAVFYDGNLLNYYSWDKDIAARRTYGQHWLITIIGFGLLAWPMKEWVFKKKNMDLALSILTLSGWVGILAFGLTGGDLFDFYLAPLYPAFLVSGAVLLNGILSRNKTLGILGILGILGFNLWTVGRAYHPQGLGIKKDMVEWSISQVGDNSFGLDVLSKNHRYNGIRYLYMLYGKEPVVSYMDATISWLYDKHEPANPGKFVVISTNDNLTQAQRERINLIVGNSEARKQFGVFDTMVLNNEGQYYQVN